MCFFSQQIPSRRSVEITPDGKLTTQINASPVVVVDGCQFDIVQHRLPAAKYSSETLVPWQPHNAALHFLIIFSWLGVC